jgi:hypothetical protein
MTTTTTTDFGAALNSAIQGGYIAQLNGGTYTISSPIVIHISSTTQGIGIDGGGATLVSKVTNGQPLIQIVVDPGVDVRYLNLSNFKIEGTGKEGDGIQIVADGNERWLYNWNITNVTVDHVGGYGLDMQGSIFEGVVSNSWMTNNGQGGAYFTNSANGGVASALRWFGGGASGNGGAGMMLDNGVRDMSVDHATFSSNGAEGINAGSGITSVTGSTFQDNHGTGVWFQNYGNFNNDTFSSSGAQNTGVSGYVVGNSSLVNSSSAWTGSGSDPTTLANLQGNGGAFITGDTGHIVTGSGISVGGEGGDNQTSETVSSQGLTAPTLSPITAATTAAVADSNGGGPIETALKAAIANGTVANLTSASSYNVTAPIIINITSSTNGAVGIDLGGAKLYSQVGGGQPVLEIVVAAGVDVSSLRLSNFTIQGNGGEGDGIKIVADGSDRSISLNVNNVNVEHVGGIGFDAIGNIQGTVFNSWMNGNGGGGARFANSTNGGVASNLDWEAGGFRKNGVAGLILENGAHDMTVKGAYFVENNGPGVDATSGIKLVQESGFENNQPAAAFVNGSSAFLDDTFSTWGPQQVAVAGTLAGGTVAITAPDAEYYGSGSGSELIANLQGNGTLAVAGAGGVVAGPNIKVTGGTTNVPGSPAADPISSIVASGAGITNGSGDLNAGHAVTLTANFTGVVAVAGGTPTLQLNDGGTATYTGGSGTSALTFSHTVQAGQNTADLAVSSLSLNGATIKDAGGQVADVSAATNYNPAGTLQIDTTAPTVSSIATSGTGITGGNGPIVTGCVVTFTVKMSEMVKVTGTPTLTLSDGGSATYTGGSDTTALSFSYTVAVGQSSTDLSVSGLSLNGGTITDGAGNAASVAGATGYNPAGTLQVNSFTQPPPTVMEKLANDTGSSATDKITSSAALTGKADASAVVHFTVDGTAIAATATANSNGVWSYTPGNLADGSHTIVASETNSSGATGSASLTFTLDTTAPAPVVTGAAFAGGQVTVTGISEAFSSLWIYDGSTWMGSATAGSDGKFSFATPADPNAPHSYGLIATDLAGNMGSSATNYVPGSSTPPTVTEKLVNDTGSSSTDHITSNDAIGGTVDANATIKFTVDGTALSASVQADKSGAWSFTPSGLTDGRHTIVASETNASGLTGSASLSVTLDTKTPVPIVSSMVLSNGEVTLSGSVGGSADVLVSIYDGNNSIGTAITDVGGGYSFTTSASAASSHVYTAIATDLAGNVGKTAGKAYLGSSGADTIVGTTTGDKIQGGTGADTLTGGGGTDKFVYRAVSDSTATSSDTITDFQHDVDKIDFTNIAGITASSGVPQFQGKLAGTGNVALNAHSVAYVESGGNTQVLVNTSGSAETVSAADSHAADMKIVLVGVNLGLTASDFHHA